MGRILQRMRGEIRLHPQDQWANAQVCAQCSQGTDRSVTHWELWDQGSGQRHLGWKICAVQLTDHLRVGFALCCHFTMYSRGKHQETKSMHFHEIQPLIYNFNVLVLTNIQHNLCLPPDVLGNMFDTLWPSLIFIFYSFFWGYRLS